MTAPQLLWANESSKPKVISKLVRPISLKLSAESTAYNAGKEWQSIASVRYIELASLSLFGQSFQLAVAALFICIESRAASLAS